MKARTASVFLLLSVLAGGCSGAQNASRITTKRVALDLAFKGGEAGAGKGATRRRVVVAQPSLSAVDIVPANLARFVPRAQRYFAAPVCPKAPVGGSVDKPVTVAVHSPPKAGTYTYFNKGTGTLQQGSVNFKFPYPPFTERTIRNVRTTGDGFTFERYERGLSADTWTTVSYAVTPDALQITKIVQHSKDGTSTITPTPALTLMTLGRGEGASWQSAGVDTDNGTVMEIDGKITKREIIDVCGKLVDTYRVESNETFVNTFSGYRYQTDSPTIYNVATQFGTIFIREIVKSTATLPTSSGTVTLHLDYTGTVQSTTPR
jgi:hypothetical protein